jgi:hypothetical protein
LADKIRDHANHNTNDSLVVSNVSCAASFREMARGYPPFGRRKYSILSWIYSGPPDENSTFPHELQVTTCCFMSATECKFKKNIDFFNIYNSIVLESLCREFGQFKAFQAGDQVQFEIEFKLFF